jgi:hypothetical protein
VVKEPYSQYAWNFIHSAFALAFIHQARGRTDKANELRDAVFSYALGTNQPLMLKFSQAFQAELALISSISFTTLSFQLATNVFKSMCWPFKPCSMIPRARSRLRWSFGQLRFNSLNPAASSALL